MSNPKYQLSRIIGEDLWQAVSIEDCMAAYLHGCLDQLLEEKKISLEKYHEGKKAILSLHDNFSDEYEKKFGLEIPINAHLFD